LDKRFHKYKGVFGKTVYFLFLGKPKSRHIGIIRFDKTRQLSSGAKMTFLFNAIQAVGVTSSMI